MPFDWTCVAGTLHEAVRPYGTWRVKGIGENQEIWFLPPYPEGETYVSLWQKFMERNIADPDERRLAFRRFDGCEIGHGSSPNETRLMLEMAEPHFDEPRSARDVLQAGGFEIRSILDDCIEVWERRAGRGRFNVFLAENPTGRHFIDLDYESHHCLHWYNILRIHVNDDDGNYPRNFFPESMPNPLATFANVVVQISDLRLNNRKYYKPILDIVTPVT
jgi:hypothetical protein